MSQRKSLDVPDELAAAGLGIADPDSGVVGAEYRPKGSETVTRVKIISDNEPYS